MKRVIAALLGMALTVPVLAEELYKGVNVLRGTVVSFGRVDPTENIGTGLFFDANYTSVALNGGVATKSFSNAPGGGGDPGLTDAYDARFTNAYFGVGFSRIIQFQYGYGSEGGLVRLRSDFNFRAVVDFLSNTRTRKDRMLLADRLTFTVSGEKYNGKGKDIFNNTTWGIGLLF
ncbi:hypothetical protein [Alcanivorax sp. 1008]|uniref:hypothetical protein n=1 Tax=Alcanivorax sp. 1008 TaxID=2816853 RepID=UPI001D7B144D|nr:hypothetical protein [Alcanivorax sp. 1008]MCC1498147.1 hypothetical protein [Alcanivorax sp. 1008]